MKRSVSLVLAERIRQRKAVTQAKVKVQYVKFSPEELAYEIPPDVSKGDWHRVNRKSVELDLDVAEVFKDSSAVNNALRKLIEAMPGRKRKIA